MIKGKSRQDPKTPAPASAWAEYERRKQLLPPMSYDEYTLACIRLARELGV